MYYNKVEICGVNTSTLKVLSDEEKKILLKKILLQLKTIKKALQDGWNTPKMQRLFLCIISLIIFL